MEATTNQFSMTIDVVHNQEKGCFEVYAINVDANLKALLLTRTYNDIIQDMKQGMVNQFNQLANPVKGSNLD